MIRTESCQEVIQALIRVQAEIKNPVKNKTAKIGGKYEFGYADLPSILEMVRPILVKNGLAICQTIVEKEKRVLLTTLAHLSGQFIESEISLPVDRPFTEIGGAITYFKRYALCSMLGIAADEDMDAFDFGYNQKPSALAAVAKHKENKTAQEK